MARQTSVVVYAVGEVGVTGARLGAAALAEPDFALCDPPLNQVLAKTPQAVRVGVFSAADEIAEVIDVTQVRVVPDAPDLVLLQLAVPSAAPATGVPVALAEDPTGVAPFRWPTRAEIIAATRGLLEQAPVPQPVLPKRVVEDPIRWLLHLFGNG